MDEDPETRAPAQARNPLDPVDPNPDPEPDFTIPPPDFGPFEAPSDPPGVKYMVIGYYPDQNNGEALAYLTFDGRLLPAWTYTTEDPETESEWHDLIPKGWTLDHQQVIVQSEDDKSDTSDAYPWTVGYAFWLMGLEGGEVKRLTDTIGNRSRGETGFGVSFKWTTPGTLWCGSEENWHWYVASSADAQFPQEWVFADGTYHTDSAATGHGDMISGSGQGPVELYAAYGGTGEGQATLSELTRILFKEDFPPQMRWANIQNLTPSPDGTKLCLFKTQMGPEASWRITNQSVVIGGTFTLTVGLFGNITNGYYTTTPIPWNATEAQVWNAINLLPIVQDPRIHGYPYQPYGSGVLPGSIGPMVFEAIPPLGVWMVIHNDNLIVTSGSGYSVTPGSFGPRGDPVWFLCDYNGDNLEQIDFGINLNSVVGWSSDSTKLHAVVPSASGDPYCRWLNYDVATGAISYPIDYTGDTLTPDGWGPLRNPPIFSPNSQKVAWVVQAYDGTKSLWVANADGSNQTEVYRQTLDFSYSDQNVLFLPRYRLAWSFNSQKLAVVDDRDEAPVWVMDLIAHTQTKIWPGSGWDNSDDQKWIYDSLDFQS
jgi:Tol biopolymer transport system component